MPRASRNVKCARGPSASAGVDELTALGGRFLFAEATELDADGVLDVAVERLEFRRLDPFPVDAEQRIALFLGPFCDLSVIALAALDQRRQDTQFLAARAFLEPRENFGWRLADGGFVGLGIAHLAELGVEQAHKLKNFGDGRDGAFTPAARDALLDRDRRRDAGDRVDIGPLELLDELPRVGVEAVEIAALAFGEEEIERERRLARAAETGDDGHFVERDVDRDVLEIVVDARRGSGSPLAWRRAYAKRAQGRCARNDRWFREDGRSI